MQPMQPYKSPGHRNFCSMQCQYLASCHTPLPFPLFFISELIVDACQSGFFASIVNSLPLCGILQCITNSRGYAACRPNSSVCVAGLCSPGRQTNGRMLDETTPCTTRWRCANSMHSYTDVTGSTNCCTMACNAAHLTHLHSLETHGETGRHTGVMQSFQEVIQHSQVCCMAVCRSFVNAMQRSQRHE